MFFEAGWETARHSTDLYWRAAMQHWERFDVATVTRIAGGKLEEPDPVKIDPGLPIWRQVENSWERAKKHHPDAIWSPRDGAWYDHHPARSEPNGGSSPLSAAAAALEERLQEINKLRQIDAVQRLQLTNRALRDYADQLAAPPP
jgi:hypothetical protein